MSPGSNASSCGSAQAPWKKSQRARLHFMSHEKNKMRNVMWADKDGSIRETNFSMAILNNRYMDTSFSGSPAQCDPETCELLDATVEFAPTQGLDESYTYRYMVRGLSD